MLIFVPDLMNFEVSSPFLLRRSLDSILVDTVTFKFLCSPVAVATGVSLAAEGTSPHPGNHTIVDFDSTLAATS